MGYYSTKLTLYSGAPIDPARNMAIEDLPSLLEKRSKIAWEDFKRVFPAEEHTIKLSYVDHEAVFSQYAGVGFNYARIDYSDGDNLYSWYYFVNSMRFIADSTFEVTLSIDALNSFGWEDWLSNRTFVRRALVKRWDENGFPILPFTAEDAEGDVIRTGFRAIQTSPAYLVWRNYITGAPTCYLIPNAPIIVNNAFTSLVAGGSYRFACSGSTVFTITSSKGSSSITLGSGAYVFVSGYVNIDGGKLEYRGYIITEEGEALLEQDGVSGTLIENDVKISARGTFVLGREDWIFTKASDSDTVTFKRLSDDVTPVETSPFSTIDRTQSDIAKIVEIPYPAGGANLIYELDSEGHIYGRFEALEASISWTKSDYPLPRFRSALKPASPVDSKDDAIALDPKLLSGQFFYYKFVYDSYSTSVFLDNFTSSDFAVNITMTPSSSVSSSLIFQITPAEGKWGDVREDFPHLIASDRNNEIALYSSDWIDYLRNGYNYDLKKQGMDIATASLTAVSGAVTSLLSIIGGVGAMSSGAGAPAGASMIAGGVIGMAGSLAGGGTSITSSLINQEQREINYKRQSANVSSINDLSLFKAYGGGGLQVQVWQAREDYLKRLRTLFYYRGYKVAQRQLPATHVRKWWDYLECVPSWTSEALANCQRRFLTLLEQRLGEGVTIYHKVGDSWDLEQEKGNYEIDS